jgi:hypothetical protein
MGMVRNLGDGYYGIEATGRTITPADFHRLTEAFSKAASIPDEAIKIVDYRYETEPRKQSQAQPNSPVALPFN